MLRRRGFAAQSAGMATYLFFSVSLTGGGGCAPVDSDAFYEGPALDDRSARRQVHSLVRDFVYGRQHCILLNNRLGNGIRRVKENPATKLSINRMLCEGAYQI